MLLPTNLSIQELLYYESQKKSMTAAYLLWFFIGFFGIHHFYMGKTGKGVLYLVLTLTVVLSIVVLIMWLIDAFTLHADVDKHNMLLLQHIQQGSKNETTATATPLAETT